MFIDDENPDVVQGGLLAGDRIALIGYKAEDGEMMSKENNYHFPFWLPAFQVFPDQ